MDDFETYQSEEVGVSLNYSGNELKVKESSNESGYGIRVILDKRVGFSYCQKEEDIKKTIKRAQTLSKYSEKTDFQFVPKTKYSHVDLVDKKIKESNLAELKEIVNDAVSVVNSKGANARVIVNEGIETISIENSNGLSGKYSKTAHSIYIEAMDGSGMGFSYNSSLKRDTNVHQLALMAAEMAKDMKKAKKIETGKYNVVITPGALESLLEVLLPSFSGEWRRKKITKLNFGDQFSEMLSVEENPLANAIGDRPHDEEGTPSRKIPLLKKGRVESFLFDRETAALAKENVDGSCSRAGYGSTPSIGHTNIEIAPGEIKSVEELGKYVEIISMHGSHTSNPTTGDFGMEVNIASLNGKEMIPVRGFIMSGNIFELLKKVIGLEKKQRKYANIIAPKIAFSDVELIA